jgi:ABC-type lipoprotein export system ATPase subunit
VLGRLGLTDLRRQPASQLSGGERQRLCLARLLVTSAPTLILDEPTSQQDEASARRVVEALQAETEAGRAVVVASHDERCFQAATVTLELGRPTSPTSSPLSAAAPGPGPVAGRQGRARRR